MCYISILKSCIIGIIFVLIGFLLMKYAPNNINNSIGYKTPFSMKNKETWNEGNYFCGKILFIAGIVFIPFSILFRYLYSNNLALSMKISLFGICIIIIGSIIFTEIHLRMRFNKK